MMNRRWKYALAALLGFSTACSTARRTAADREQPARETADSTASGRAAADTARVQINRIRLMYGVPSPPPEAVQPAETEARSGAETAR